MDSESNMQPQYTKLPTEERHASKLNGLCKRFEILPLVAFVFLTYNAALSIYRSRGNPWDLAFVISCYAELILLLLCLKKRENLGADASVEQVYRLKIIVWILTTLLTVTFAYRVATIMPLPLKIVVWVMSGSVVTAGFYAFFIFNDGVKESRSTYLKLDNAEEQENIYHNQLSPEEKV